MKTLCQIKQGLLTRGVFANGAARNSSARWDWGCNKRQHRTFHIQKDVLPYASSSLPCHVSAALACMFRMDSTHLHLTLCPLSVEGSGTHERRLREWHGPQLLSALGLGSKPRTSSIPHTTRVPSPIPYRSLPLSPSLTLCPIKNMPNFRAGSLTRGVFANGVARHPQRAGIGI